MDDPGGWGTHQEGGGYIEARKQWMRGWATIGRRVDTEEVGERRLPPNNRVNLVAPRVGLGAPRTKCQERMAAM